MRRIPAGGGLTSAGEHRSLKGSQTQTSRLQIAARFSGRSQIAHTAPYFPGASEHRRPNCNLSLAHRAVERALSAGTLHADLSQIHRPGADSGAPVVGRVPHLPPATLALAATLRGAPPHSPWRSRTNVLASLPGKRSRHSRSESKGRRAVREPRDQDRRWRCRGAAPARRRQRLRHVVQRRQGQPARQAAVRASASAPGRQHLLHAAADDHVFQSPPQVFAAIRKRRHVRFVEVQSDFRSNWDNGFAHTVGLSAFNQRNHRYVSLYGQSGASRSRDWQDTPVRGFRSRGPGERAARGQDRSASAFHVFRRNPGRLRVFSGNTACASAP